MIKMLVTMTAVAVATFAASAADYLSHNYLADVQSSSDGSGNFTYTFEGSSINPDFSFYFTSGSGTISFQSYGVLDVQTPVGWHASVSDTGLITLQYTGSGGAWIYDVPLTFNLHSTISAMTLYDGSALYPRGMISGPYCEYGNPGNGGLGSQEFNFLGPVQPVPEPPSTACLATAMVALTFISWKPWRSGKLRHAPTPNRK
jgi:hypothetical protein